MKTYPAKLLLFGEHTVNTGSQALAMPLHLYSGRWDYAPLAGKEQLAARQILLPRFADFLEKLQQKGNLICPVDVPLFKKALMEGLVFESDIPKGYGAGSSGALVAAVFGEWGKFSSLTDKTGKAKEEWKEDLGELKKGLAQMESFFHGTSSGTDPLICFLQKPVLLNLKDIRVVSLQVPDPSPQLFLLDTGFERQATPMIEYFLEKIKDAAFHGRCKTELLPAVDSAIHAFLEGRGEVVFENMHSIGEFQFRFLEKMIPEKFRPLWQEGLDGDLFKLKVCGAGGGGFLLGITRDFEKLKNLYPQHRFLVVE